MQIKEVFIKHIRKGVIAILLLILTPIIASVINSCFEKRMTIEYSIENISREYDSNLIEQNSYISKLMIKNKGKDKINDINVFFDQKLIDIKNENPEILCELTNNNINIFSLYVDETITFIIRTRNELRDYDINIRQPFGIVINKPKENNLILILVVTFIVLPTLNLPF